MNDGPTLTSPPAPPAEDKVEGPRTVDKDFVYSQKVGRNLDDGGIYLDDVQRQQAEIQRAKVEGRKPDLNNPGSTVGTPLVSVATVASSIPKDVRVVPDVTLPVVVTDDDEAALIERSNASGDK